MADDITAAHTTTQTIHTVIAYPEHTARVKDKYQAEFDAAERRLKKLGLYKCVVCGCVPGQIGWDGAKVTIELHHDKVEFSLENTIDLDKASEAFGQHFESDDDFAQWIDSPANLEPLCTYHHRGGEGIHVTSGPLWGVLRIVKTEFHTFIQSKGNI